jgi:hypothetical protein
MSDQSAKRPEAGEIDIREGCFDWDISNPGLLHRAGETLPR